MAFGSFYAFPLNLGAIMVNLSGASAVLVLPFAAGVGILSAAISASYAAQIEAGADANGTTFRAAIRQGWRATLRLEPRNVPRHIAITGAVIILVAAIPFAAQPGWLAAARLWACAVLLLLALIDARCGLLPDALTLPLLWAGLLLAWAGMGTALHDAVAGAAAGYLSLRFINAIFTATRGRSGMGGGDMKLVAALGAWLGWMPLPMVLLAACIGGIGFACAMLGRQGWRASLAFGPFLALSGAIGLVGDPVVQFLF